MATVKCRQCGYLAIRNRETRELEEVGLDIREGERFPASGYYAGYVLMSTPHHVIRPVCFRVEPEFMKESPPSDESNNQEKFLEIIDRDRQCDRFTQWKHGFSPKEHLEMEWLEAQKRREDERDIKAAAREDQRDKDAHSRHMRELMLIGVIAPLAAISTQFMTTRMQIDATVKQAVRDHHEELKKTSPVIPPPELKPSK